MRQKYKNPYLKNNRRSALHVFLWQIGYYNEKKRFEPLPEDFIYPNAQSRLDLKKPSVTWVCHSTFWIRAFGISMLMDPIWNHRCSPLSFVGPKCRLTPQPSFDKIDAVDYVVISHNHYDHLDLRTIRQLHDKHPKIVWIVPQGVKKWFLRTLKVKKEQVIELKWWERFSLDHISFTSVPAQHFSGRGLLDQNRSLWMGCVIEFKSYNKRVYFAGDTGYNSVDFKKIGTLFKGMDLSLLPIGVYAPRKFMQPVHVNPHESLLIHKDVRSKLSVAGHWGTFRLSSEGMQRPPYDLYCALQRENINVEEFRVLNPGQAINW